MVYVRIVAWIREKKPTTHSNSHWICIRRIQNMNCIKSCTSNKVIEISIILVIHHKIFMQEEVDRKTDKRVSNLHLFTYSFDSCSFSKFFTCPILKWVECFVKLLAISYSYFEKKNVMTKRKCHCFTFAT